MESKTCTVCSVEKPVSEFSFRKQRNNWNSYCKECNSLRNMSRTYGVSPETYGVLLKAQNHCCAICGGHEDHVESRGSVHRKLCVDHSHSSGTVRGLLCHNCNVLLGHAGDNVSILAKAIDYLVSHKE